MVQRSNKVKPGFEIRPYTVKELCFMYGASRNTFKKWLIVYVPGLTVRCGNYYTSLQVEMIVVGIGLPNKAAKTYCFF